MGKLEAILAPYVGKKGGLVSALQDVQGALGYLSEEALREVSCVLGVPLAQVYGVASFYSQFYFRPRGRHVVRVCTGTACHIKGAMRVLSRLEELLGIKAGETSADLNFTLETVNCVGCCALAPVVVVNDQVVRPRDHRRLEDWLRKERRGAASAER